MKNIRHHPVRGSSIKIIILDKKGSSQAKNGMEFPNVGRGWGESDSINKKGLPMIG
jgi:hypothetical protein